MSGSVVPVSECDYLEEDAEIKWAKNSVVFHSYLLKKF